MSDSSDDMECLSGVYETYLEKLHKKEDEWEKGYHINKKGKKYKLQDMTISHLQNAIRFFEELNTTPLEEELKKRQII